MHYEQFSSLSGPFCALLVFPYGLHLLMRAYDTGLGDLLGIMSWKRYEADETTALLCLGLLIQLKEERAWSEIVLREENIPTSWNSFVFFFSWGSQGGPPGGTASILLLNEDFWLRPILVWSLNSEVIVKNEVQHYAFFLWLSLHLSRTFSLISKNHNIKISLQYIVTVIAVCYSYKDVLCLLPSSLKLVEEDSIGFFCT